VVPGVEALAGHGRLFVVVGAFDGIHRGHRYLLRRLQREALRRSARPTVITFDHHPDEVILGSAPPLLCDPAERLERLARAGVEVVVVEHFDARLRATPYDAFVRSIAARTELAGFLMTPDAAFGHERRGTPEALAELGRTAGFEVLVVPAMDLQSRPVRSAEIRAAIGSGDLAAAAELLGRRYAVVGEVTVGPGRPAAAGRPVLPAGRQATGAGGFELRLSFPMPVALPPAGVYRVRVGRPISPGGRAAGTREAQAVVGMDPSSLVLRGPGRPPAGERLRIVFA
jgi:riboflavin kinase/FMN adenylyltransferase